NDVLTLWDSYLTHKSKGLKKEAADLLNKVICNIEALDFTVIKNFAYYLTDLHREEHLKIDFRLFEKLIYPVLVSEINLNALTSNRRLAQFDQFLLPSNPLFKNLKEQLNYESEYFEPADFYEKEITLNQNDLIAVDGLLTRIAANLNYATHELPEYGLLWHIEYFDEELKQFEQFLLLSPEKDLWSERVEHWKFALKTWTDYTSNQETYKNYKDYLDKNQLTFLM